MRNGRYEMDFDHAAEAVKAQGASMVILCSPHNPSGRVWERAELEALAAFATEHELVLVSDEIHHDLVLGEVKHTAMALIEGIADRLVMMTASTKTFNIAGAHIGNVIIADPVLRQRFSDVINKMGISPNSFGMHMATAAYSPEGAAWVDALNLYLDRNRKTFDAAVNAIPGVKSMPLQATYLSWVDFTGTGMTEAEFTARVANVARIATNQGSAFGLGGETYLRFNIAMPHSQIVEAAARLTAAFKDLQ